MAMMGGGLGPQAMFSFRRDSSVTKQRLAPGTVRRIARYAQPFSRHIAAFLAPGRGRPCHRRSPTRC